LHPRKDLLSVESPIFQPLRCVRVRWVRVMILIRVKVKLRVKVRVKVKISGTPQKRRVDCGESYLSTPKALQ
jgi:hypothetical protein